MPVPSQAPHDPLKLVAKHSSLAAHRTEGAGAAQKLLCGLVVPHDVQAEGTASLAALSALCMYLKRCHADKELATGTHKVAKP